MKVNLAGRHFENATVIKRIGTKNHASLWECRCDCGNIFKATAGHLISGHSKSCGCLRKKQASSNFRTHGASESRLHRIWANMKTRCTNNNDPSYKNYGGRGISICSEWSDDFEAFANWAKNNGYSELLTIDRKDNAKGYTPDNCRWVDFKTQSRNRRNNHIIEYKGEKKTLAEWCEEYGHNYHTLLKRITTGWDIEKALTTRPIEKYRNSKGATNT